MSQDLQEPKKQSNANEEIDLIVLFNMIGNAFARFFNFIGSIFKAIFSVIVYALKAIIIHFKIIAVVILIAGILGYIADQFKPTIYSSKMVVKPYFDSKYQLITNINYYNALIEEKDTNTLSEIFDVDEESAKQIKNFDIELGPETENDKIIQYDRFLASLDSIRAQDVAFDDFVDNRSIYSGDLYEISIESEKKDIFKSL